MRALSVLGVRLRTIALAGAAAFAMPMMAQNNGQWAIELGQRGFVSGAPFDLSSLDSVDTVNGNVTLSIPLAALPAGHGGAGLNVTLAYNSGTYDTSDYYVYEGSSAAPPQFHTDVTLLWPYSGYLWLYGYQYGLYQEQRPVQPVYVGSYNSSGCVVQVPGNGLDVVNSSQSALYPVRLFALFPDGSSHVLVPMNVIYSTSDGWSGSDWVGRLIGCPEETAPTAPSPSTPLNYITQDGTFVRLSVTGRASGSGDPIWTMLFPDGRRINGVGLNAEQIVDRNGNAIAISNSGSSCFALQGDPSDAVTTITDAYGRCVQIEHGLTSANNPTTTDWVTQQGADGGAALITKVNWTAEPIDFVYQIGNGVACQYGYQTLCDFGNGSAPLMCQAPPPSPPNTLVSSTVGACTPQAMMMVTSVDLSQAGFFPAGTPLTYTFGYSNVLNNGYGISTCTYCQVTDVTLPQGASTPWANAAKIHYTFQVPSATPAYLPDMPISAKTLTHTDPYTGATYTDTWAYAISVPLGVSSTVPSGSVTNPDGSKTNYYVYPPPAILGGHAFKIDKIDSTGNLLSRLEQMWVANTVSTLAPPASGANVYLRADFRSVAPQNSATPSLSAIRVYNEDVNGNVGEVDEADWVPYSNVSSLGHSSLGDITQVPSISPVRSTVNGYYVSASSSPYWSAFWSGSGTAPPCAIGNPCILDSKTSTEILSGSTPVAYSEFTYDDPTGSGMDSASGAGNVTTEARWDNSTNLGMTQPLTSSNSIATHRTYFCGDLATETDPMGNTRQFSYNPGCTGIPPAVPYPLSLVEALGTGIARTWSFTWDTNSGRLLSEIDADNQVPITATYDPRGRETLRTLSGSWRTATAYNDSLQNAVASQDLNVASDGIVQTTSLTDDLGRVYNTQSTDGTCTTNIQTISLQQTPPPGAMGYGYSYQLTSNPFCTTGDGTMGWTRTMTDPLGRVREVAHFSGSGLPAPWGSNTVSTGAAETTYSASSSDATYTVTDEAGAYRTMTMDGLNRLIGVNEAGTYSTSYAYNALDDLISVNQSGLIRGFAYTSLGRLSTASNPESGNMAYTYDKNGNLLTRTDARNIVTTSTYDQLNRITSKTYSDGITLTPVTYAYGTSTTMCGTYSIGRLCSVSNSASTTNYTYNDQAGPVTKSAQITGGVTYTFPTYTYNMLGAVASEAYPSGRTVSYTFDAGGRVNTVSGSLTTASGPVTTAYAGSSGNPITYASHHALSVLPMGNAVTETWGYNPRLQPTSVGAATAAGSLLTLGYVYGATSTQNNGNVSSATIGVPGLSAISQAFTYDGENRLLTAVENSSACTQSFTDWCQQFTYDAFGNRAASSFGQGVSPLTPTAFTSSNRNSGSGWVYDASGNITADPGQSAYAYDAENRQIAYCVNASTCSVSNATMSYSYDGDGKRVQTQASSGATTTFVYDAHGELVAEYGSPALAFSCTCYVTVDSLGSTRMVTNQGGVVSREDFLPFGQSILATSGGPRSGVTGYGATIRQQFTSKERDQESGLDYFGVRYMSSAEGRFTSPDPLLWLSWQSGNDDEQARFREFISDPQNFNLYTYGRNNPLKYSDPTGLDVEVGVTFVGNISDDEKKRILSAVQGYLENLKVGKVVVRDADAPGQDKRTSWQKLKDLFTVDYHSITVDLQNRNAFGNDADRPNFVKAWNMATTGDPDETFGDLRKADPTQWSNIIAWRVLHETISHAFGIGPDSDQLVPVGGPRDGTLIQGAYGRGKPGIPPLNPSDTRAIQQLLVPRTRSYDR